ncbi:ATP-binding protein [Paraburkholderia strydomiana]|uniref:ATP-binding protein n=1 Tax=Paraburkholderia strydomiana TaxID=1245417 RepID=UPI0038BA429C
MRSQTVDEGSFVFGPFVFLPGRRTLLKGQKQIRLGSRAAEILHLLVSRAGDLITKEELIAHTWPSTFVEDANVKVHVSALRRALGEVRPDATYIATVAGRGYRFVAPVLMTNEGGPREFFAASLTTALPAKANIVGRDSEIEAVTHALASERVVTLAGPIGVGKASVARAAAGSVASQFSDGSSVIDFSMIGDLSEASNFIAVVLGLRAAPDMTEPLLDYLQHRKMLIILDHCERAPVSLRVFVSRFFASPSRSTILAISLEPLRVPGERVHRIGLLPYPIRSESVKLSTEAALKFPAVLMLVERARDLAGYEVTEDDLPALVGLTQITDGRPRSMMSALSNLLPQFSFAEMLDIVTRRVLHGPQVGEPDDPQCLVSGKTDFGYGRLSTEEATLFRVLSVFFGHFALEDAVALTRPLGWDMHQTFMALSSLIAKSLVWVAATGNVVTYRLLAAERFFARARLNEAPEECRRARTLHSNLILSIMLKGRDEWRWGKPETWRCQYLSRSEDLLEAIKWAATGDTDAALVLKLTEVAGMLWDEQSQLVAHLAHLRRALEIVPDRPDLTEARSRVATSYARSLTFSGDLGEATGRAWSAAIASTAEARNETNYLSTVLGYCSYLLITGQSDKLGEQITKFQAVAKRSSDPSVVFDVERLKLIAALDAGDALAARDGFDNLARCVGHSSPSSDINRYRSERYVSIQAYGALVRCLTDVTYKAPEYSVLLDDDVAVAFPPGARAIFCTVAALPIAYWHDDADQLEKLVMIVRAHERSDQAVLFRLILDFYDTVASHLRGQKHALAEMHSLVTQLIASGYQRRTAFYLSMVANAALDLGETRLASTLIEYAYKQHERCQEMWCLPELIRVEARLALVMGDGKIALSLLAAARSQAIKMGLQLFLRRIQFDEQSLHDSARSDQRRAQSA